MAGEDHATVAFESDAGASVLLLANLAVHGEPAALVDRLHIVGERGSLRLQGDTLSCEGDAPASQRYDMPQCYAESYAATLSHFIDALTAGTPFETSPEDNLRTLRLVEDIYTAGPGGAR
jgi:predicted dehydrogenase